MQDIILNHVLPQLADMFADNFEKYEAGVSEEIKTAGPRKAVAR